MVKIMRHLYSLVVIACLVGCGLIGCGKSGDEYAAKGNEYLRSGDIAKAVLEFEKAVEAEPDNHESRNSLGAALSSIGDFGRAVEHFRAAVRIKQDFVEGHYNLGRAYAEMGSLDEALNQFSTVLQLDSTFALAYLSGGDILAARGLGEQAADSYEGAIRFDPNLLPAYLRLASVYIGTGEHERAVNLLLRARTLRPEDPEIVSMAGRAAIRNRDFDQAILLIKEAMEMDSLNLVYRNDLATALMLSRRRDEAIEQWQWILARNPEPGLEQVVRQNLERAESGEALEVLPE
jgi:tetratricopeptide (TPR) repeat protein